ncbi:hypothetical protein [Tateyamaria sp. SN6-1]|uniref:hypothetical protein n=1 Tax=Tateyamaria sp. SN6-1 TaxID=3092148 RepID=UPI0039F6249A
MKPSQTSSQCDRAPNPHEHLLEDAPYDQHEHICLGIARLYFSTFATPANHNWMRAIAFAENAFDHDSGANMATLVLRVIQAVRTSRTSVFMFSNPDCPGCARILSEHERRLVTTIACVRRGRHEMAQVEMMMLCEGNDTATVMAWLTELAMALPAPCADRDAAIARTRSRSHEPHHD